MKHTVTHSRARLELVRTVTCGDCQTWTIVNNKAVAYGCLFLTSGLTGSWKGALRMLLRIRRVRRSHFYKDSQYSESSRTERCEI